MPYHVAPPIRAIEENEEAAGILAAYDTVAVTYQKALETAGTVAKAVPFNKTMIIEGTAYTQA